MKIANIITAALLCAASITAHAQQGPWSGKLDVMGTKLPLVFSFTADSCTFSSPSQGVSGMAAVKTVGTDGTVKVSIGAIGAVYEGKLCADSITGTFKQNGFTLPLTLKPGEPVVIRPQTPVPPFPYREKSMSFVSGGFTLNGTLTLPERCTKNTPVVLMVTGSGQQNRDEEMFGHRPFAVLADALARNGIASLRYDDRGWGDKSVNFQNFTTYDFKDDAAAGLQALRKRFKKVGVLGHSEGGTIALLLAEEGKPDFVVSLAGMAVSGRATILKQNRVAVLSMGLSADMADQYCAWVDKVLDEIVAGKKADDISTDGVSPMLRALLKRSVEMGDTRYIAAFVNVDAGKNLQKIKCPVLALNGTKDMQVDCNDNTFVLEKGLTHCPHQVLRLDGLNHMLQHCTTGSVVEYQQIEETIAPEVLERVAQWISGLKRK